MSVLKWLHLVAFVHFVFGIYYDLNYLEFPPSFQMNNSFIPLKGRLKFLTFWDLVIQTVYFGVALLNDMFGSNENVPSKMPLVRRIKDYMFSAFAFPIAVYVSVTFWSLMAVDRELVFPKVLDAYFPSWLNHLMHTNILVFILLEMFLTFRQYPTRKTGIMGLSFILISYLSWIHIIYFNTGIWVYPLLAVLDWPMRFVFYAVSVTFGILLYFIGEFLNNKLWSKQISQMKRSGRKKAN